VNRPELTTDPDAMIDRDPDRDGVPLTLMRGGSSKGLVFAAADLPAEVAARDDLLLRLMGSPDDRQIDGLGGAHPLTSKVAIVSLSDDPSADLDYLFLQVSVDEPLVSDRQNCGNMLAAVAPFAIERGMLQPDPSTDRAEVRIRLLNTGGAATATVGLDRGRVVYAGDSEVSGVPGTAAPIRLDFEDVAGSSCGALLPTGNPVDTIATDDVGPVSVTLIDNGMPVVVMRADAVGVTGNESPAELEGNDRLRRVLESIRLKAGPMMNLGDVADTTVPKLTMVSEPLRGGAINTRTFIPHRCHEAIGVLGAVSVATAAMIPGTPASEVASLGTGETVTVEHPTGTFDAAITLSITEGTAVAERSGIIRTARKLMDGRGYPRPQ
jgi:4-oxalomesaconate tautomerase